VELIPRGVFVHPVQVARVEGNLRGKAEENLGHKLVGVSTLASMQTIKPALITSMRDTTIPL